jgi:hypothetical protein
MLEGINLWGFIPQPRCRKICPWRKISQTLNVTANTSKNMITAFRNVKPYSLAEKQGCFTETSAYIFRIEQ